MTAHRTIATASIALGVMACSAPKPKDYVDSKRGVQLTYPAGWTVEELAAEDVLLLMSPVQEANWQTNVFLEVRTDLDPSQPVEQRLASVVESLPSQKKGFSLVSSRALSHASGLAGGELVYTHSSQGVPVTERELILWLPDNRILFVTASALTSLLAKYEGEINLILGSVRPVGQ